ncbi:MAG: hypothetical protein KKE12_17710 [Proteobacteria bacterium]|nr:hypothetical protein [Pseudomonadota bacterium]
MVCDILERIINGADLETMEGYQILEGAENEIIKKSKIPCKKGSEEKTLIDRFIDGDDLETVEPEEVFKDTTWVDPTILRSEYGIEKQQFSTFVLGCVGHSLLHFLHKERKEKKTNRNRLQRCWNCKTFFIKKRADAQGTCEACKKNGVQKPRDAIYFREYRKAVKQKKENNEIRAYKEAKDCTWAEARDAHKK